MNARQKARIEMFKRTVTFGLEHAAEFVPKTAGDPPTRAQQLFAELSAILVQAGKAHSRQESGGYGAGTSDKASLRDALMSELRSISLSVTFLAADRREPALLERFRSPASCSDEQLAARARGFVEAIKELQLADELIALEHEPDFVEVLEERIQEFAQAGSGQSGALLQQAGATASLAPLVSRGLIVVKGLNSIIKNKFKDSAAILGSWKSANHVERIGERSQRTVTPFAPASPAVPVALLTMASAPSV